MTINKFYELPKTSQSLSANKEAKAIEKAERLIVDYDRIFADMQKSFDNIVEVFRKESQGDQNDQ